MTLFDTGDPDELREQLEIERAMQLMFATQICAQIEADCDDPVLFALAQAFRAAGTRERRLRNALKIVVAG